MGMIFIPCYKGRISCLFMSTNEESFPLAGNPMMDQVIDTRLVYTDVHLVLQVTATSLKNIPPVKIYLMGSRF